MSRNVRERRRSFTLVAGLLLLTIAVFAPLGGHDFVNYDDDDYVTENPVVGAGLTGQGVRWAFTNAGYASNWHPLTWLSHMLDVSLFGLAPGRHHLMSLLYHLATAVLLFSVLQRVIGTAWPSALAAALFAVHPLHVESVAWVSDRKGLLCALFWVLTVGAYGSYVKRRTPTRYAAVALCHALSLLAKPFAVTLPLVLLLLDYWPLGRLHGRPAASRGAAQAVAAGKLVVEKVPLLGLSLASGLVTIFAQRQGGSITSLDLLVRVDNAILSYGRYLAKTLWPAKLSIIYPHPGVRQPAWEVFGAGLILLGISVCALLWRRRRPHLMVGWLWYVVTLVPVIGLLHVGSAAMADRYSYLPLTGVFVAASWELRQVVRRWRRGTILAAVAGALALALLAVAARQQVGHWRDSVSLFRHALEVTERNSMAHFNLGMAHVARREYAQALPQVTEALKLDPTFEEARINRDILLQILRLRPGNRPPVPDPSQAR